jgi:hypothetical protein
MYEFSVLLLSETNMSTHEKVFGCQKSGGTERRGTWVNFRVIFPEGAKSQRYKET